VKRAIALTAVVSSLATLAVQWALASAGVAARVVLDNAKVVTTEVSYAPGSRREPGIRGHDQVIVFLDDCRYERTDSKTGEKTIRTRRAGEVIWHSKGEDAPLLVNLGSKPYRTIVVELK